MPYFFTCVVLGVIAAAPLGPLCILVFNRGARYGAMAGIATGAGAALADALYCMLGLAGVLDIVTRYAHIMRWVNGCGAVMLCVFGVLLIAHRVPSGSPVSRVSAYSSMMSQAFMITTLNPLVALFFMTVGMQSLAGYRSPSVLLGGVGVCIGSLSVFSIASVLGSYVGKRVPPRHIAHLQLITGSIVLIAGVYGLAYITGFTQLFS